MNRCPLPNIRPPISYLMLAIWNVSFAICIAACSRPDNTWARVREIGAMRVGMDASFPPFEAVGVDGALIGLDVDLARELGRRLGVKVQFVANLPYDGLYDALAVGRVDVVISALVVNPDRMADFAYSASYFDAGQMLVVRASSVSPISSGDEEGSIKEMIDLANRSLAVEFGTQGDLEARKWVRRLPNLTIVSHETALDALTAVVEGRADAALVDHVSALGAGSGGDLMIVGEPIVEELYAVAVHRDSRYLLRAINDALADMETDGTLEAMRTKWLEGGY